MGKHEAMNERHVTRIITLKLLVGQGQNTFPQFAGL
jgi:hypothetical protein